MTTLTYLDDTWLDQERARLSGLTQRLESAADLLASLANHAPEVAERLNDLGRREVDLRASLNAQAVQQRQALQQEAGEARAALDTHLHRVIEDLSQLSEAGMLMEARQGIRELRIHLQDLQVLLAESSARFSQQLLWQEQARKVLDQQGEHLTEELSRLEVQTGAYPAAWQETVEHTFREEAANRLKAVQELESRMRVEMTHRQDLSSLINSWRADLDAVQSLQGVHQTQQEEISGNVQQVMGQLEETLPLLAELRETLDGQRHVILVQQEHGAQIERRVSALPTETAALIETRTAPLQVTQMHLEQGMISTQAALDELRGELAVLRSDNAGLVTRLATEEARSELLRTELVSALKSGLDRLNTEWLVKAETSHRTAQETEARLVEHDQLLNTGLEEHSRILNEVRSSMPNLLEPIEARLGILQRNVDDVERQTSSNGQRLQIFLSWFKAAGTVARLRGSPE